MHKTSIRGVAIVGAALLTAVGVFAGVHLTGRSVVRVQGVSTLDAKGATTTPPGTTTTNAPSTTTAPVGAGIGIATQLPIGQYVDTQTAGTPHYVFTIASEVGQTFKGSFYFVYQDGRSSSAAAYSAMATNGGSMTLTATSVGPGPGRAGGPPVGAPNPGIGTAHSGTYGNRTLTLSNCGSYLYWANPQANQGPPESCTFSFSG